MGWSSGSTKRREWQERLQRFAGSRMTIAAFCDREGVSAPSFYQWRQKLAGERQPASATARQGGAARAVAPQAFVPVQITQSATVQMRLPNGVQVSLPAGDAALLAAAIAAAGNLAAVDREGEAC